MMGRKIGGYLTIYVSLSLTVMLSLCLTLIGGAVKSSVRLEADCIADTALNSVMAEYHRELFSQYNLFFIDSSYGTGYPSYYNTEARLRFYLEQNTAEEECTYFSFLYKDLLGLWLEDVYIQQAAVASDHEGLLFQKKAARAVWDDVGLGLVQQVLDWVGAIQDKGLLEQDFASKAEEVDAKIEASVDNRRQLEEEKWISVEVQNPAEHMNAMRKEGILKWVVEDVKKVSDRQTDLSGYISARKKRDGINQGNAEPAEELSVVEKILFHEYLIRYSGHYGQEKEDSLLLYQTEYLLGGKNSDAENLSHVASVICGIREAANVMYLYSNASKKAVAEAVATVLSAAVLMPQVQPLFTAALMLGWAYLESLYDTKLLLAGGRVPLLKDDSSWHYDLDSILESVDMQLKDRDREGMSYTDYLHVLLYLADMQKITFRFMDLMEMDIRRTKGNEAFRMDGCIDCIEATIFFKSGNGSVYEVNRRKEYQ